MGDKKELTRRTALTAAGGLGLSALAGQAGAADKEAEQKSKKGKKLPELSPRKNLAHAMDKKGKPLDIVKAAPVLEIQYHTFDFNQSNGNDWAEQRKILTAPSGWTLVSTTMVTWSLSFLPDDHHWGMGGIHTFVTVESGAVVLHAAAILRDNNGDDKWSGSVTIQVQFLG